MAQANSQDASTETADGEADPASTNAYISPLADFLLLFLSTVIGAGAVVVLL